MALNSDDIKKMLVSEAYEQRLSAINHLSHIDTDTAFELVQIVVADPKARVRYAAVSKLATVGIANPSKSLDVLRHTLLTDKEADVRAAAADAIGALHLKDGFDDLKTVYYQTSDWIIQLSIVAALGELGDSRGFEILDHALNGENDLIHAIAIGALGELGDHRAIPLLISQSTNPDWQVRYRVAQALGQFNGPDVEATLALLAEDSIAQIAQEATTHLS